MQTSDTKRKMRSNSTKLHRHAYEELILWLVTRCCFSCKT